MAQLIEVNGEVIEFPDDMSDAQIAAVLKGQQTQVQPPSMSSELGRQLGLTARAGLRGLSFAPNAVADFVSGAANLGLMATGSERRVPSLSQVQQEALNQTFPTPRPGLESAIQTGAEAVAGLMTPGLRLPIAPQVEGATARSVGTRAGAEAAGTAAGAISGEQASRLTEEAGFNPLVSLAAGLATGTVVGSGTGKLGFTLASPRQEPITIEQIRNRASQGYRAMDEAGIALRSSGVKDTLIPSIQKSLAKENYDPEIVAAHKPIQDNLKLLDKIISDPFVDFGRLEKVRSTFSGLSQGTDDTARLAKEVTTQIDSFLGNLKNKDTISTTGKSAEEALKALQNARKDWRNQSRAQVLQDILESSSAIVEGKGGAISDVLRNKLVNLTSNTEKMKMFSTAEQNVIRAATKATDLESFLNIMAKFNPQRGLAQASMATTGLTSSAVGSGPAQLAGFGLTGMGTAGYLSDKTLEALRRRELQGLVSQIASGNLQPPKQGFAVPGLFGATMGTTR
jgi:hypothetical protein